MYSKVQITFCRSLMLSSSVNSSISWSCSSDLAQYYSVFWFSLECHVHSSKMQVTLQSKCNQMQSIKQMPTLMVQVLWSLRSHALFSFCLSSWKCCQMRKQTKPKEILFLPNNLVEFSVYKQFLCKHHLLFREILSVLIALIFASWVPKLAHHFFPPVSYCISCREFFI